MASSNFHIDAKASTLVVRTRAAGLLGRLAHDLEIAAGELTGRASTDGEAWTADLTVPVPSLRVVGVLHGDRVDEATLSASDRAEIERRIREEVFAGASEAKAHAEGPWRATGEVTVSLSGRSSRVAHAVRVSAREGGGSLATGRVELSLRALGIPEVKGPLGAFRVSDTVEVVYSIVMVPEG